MSGYETGKRAADLVVAAVVLVLVAPLLAALALSVRLHLGSPVLFRQTRPGRDGEVFVLLKLRTMRDVDEAAGLVTDAQRLTRWGRWLRSLSLDELPTLWNVLRGEMSLVGPRPLLVEYLDRYTSEQHRRHEVRPGVTGLAQVSGRNHLGWSERLALDVEYVDRRCLALDLVILARTVRALVVREGITAPGAATMPEFRGEGGVRS